MLKYTVYILKCNDQSYYVGITNDINRRVSEHNEGKDPRSYTNSRRPLQLVYVNEFNSPNDAIAFEKRIKGWSRSKKEALIRGDWDELKRLSNHKKNN